MNGSIVIYLKKCLVSLGFLTHLEITVVLSACQGKLTEGPVLLGALDTTFLVLLNVFFVFFFLYPFSVCTELYSRVCLFLKGNPYLYSGS